MGCTLCTGVWRRSSAAAVGRLPRSRDESADDLLAQSVALRRWLAQEELHLLKIDPANLDTLLNQHAGFAHRLFEVTAIAWIPA